MNISHDNKEFNALAMDCAGIQKNKNPGAKMSTGTDASAIQGRPGAQVALLQSPILPVVSLPYCENRIFKVLPLTNHIPVD